MSSVFVCGDFHPYECRAGCPHCERIVTEAHNPATCLFCLDDDGLCGAACGAAQDTATSPFCRPCYERLNAEDADDA